MQTIKKLKDIHNPTQDTIRNFALNNYFLIIWLFCFFLSFLYLLICTKSSPLYPLNDWVDANAFFTMGKGMMNGKIPYRDLFEQKGPLLYLIHGFSYLISEKSFLGVFIFEVLSFSCFLFFCFKLMLLFVEGKYALISLPIIATLILNLKSFSHGDSAEEFCLPLLAVSLYYLINYFINVYPRPIANKWVLFNGIITGCVFWIKFTLIGFWIGWAASFFLCMVLNKQFVQAGKIIFFFLAGMLISTIPWVIYFGVNNSISYWVNTYFIINMTSYVVSTSILGGIKFTLGQIIFHFFLNPISSGLLWLGVIVFVFTKKFLRSRLIRICLLFCIISLVFGIYGGGRGYIHYFIIISPFIILGVIIVVNQIVIKFHKILSIRFLVLTILITVISTLLFSLRFNQNSYLIDSNKNNLVQYKYASIINQTKEATLLNYGALDMGFYTVTGITPNIRFFENQNIQYSKFPLIMNEQNRYIKEKIVEYIVVIQRASDYLNTKNIPFLYINYKLIGFETQEFENTVNYYYLFKLIH